MIIGQLIKYGLFSTGLVILLVFIAVLLIKYGRNLEKIKATEEKDAEYEKMQKIHSAHTAMSANERLDWLRKHRKD